MPIVNITWYLALAGNWTPVAEFTSHIEYHYTTYPWKDSTEIPIQQLTISIARTVTWPCIKFELSIKFRILEIMLYHHKKGLKFWFRKSCFFRYYITANQGVNARCATNFIFVFKLKNLRRETNLHPIRKISCKQFVVPSL